VNTVLVGAVVVLAALLWGFRLLGYEVLVVQSGSMEPEYPVGSMVYVKPVDAEQLRTGDVITFEMGGGIRGTHRIIEVLRDGSSLEFRTKGDANEVEDASPVPAEYVVGRVEFCIPKLGFFAAYIQQTPGKYICLCATVALLIMTVLPDLVFPEDKKNKKQEEET